MDPVVRKLRKKLRQIEALEKLGRELSSEEADKVARKHEIRADLQSRLQESNSQQDLAYDTSSVLTTEVSSVSDESTCNEKTNIRRGHVREPESRYPDNDVTTNVTTGAVSLQQPQDSLNKQEKQMYQQVINQSDQQIENGKTNSLPAKEHGDDSATDESRVDSIDVSPVVAKGQSRKKQSGKKRAPSNAEIFRSGKFGVQLLEGHNDRILSVDCDDSIVVTGSVDTMVKVWDAASGVELKSLGGHEKDVTSVVIVGKHEPLCIADSSGGYDYPDDSCVIISASLDCTFRLWNEREGLLIKSVYTFSPLRSVRYSSKKILTGSDGGKLELWDIETCSNIISTREHDVAIASIWFDFPDVVTADVLGCVIVWHVSRSAPGVCTFKKKGSRRLDSKHTDSSDVTNTALYHYTIHSLCVNMDKRRVYWGDNGINIKMWNIETGDVAKLQNHSGCWGSTNAVALCGLWVVAAGYNLDSGQGYLTVRNADDNTYVATVSCPDCPCIDCLTCCPSSGNDKRWRWFTGGKQLRMWEWSDPSRKLPRKSGPRSIVSPISDPQFEQARDTDTEESESDSESNGSSTEQPSDPKSTKNLDEQPQYSSIWSWCNIL